MSMTKESQKSYLSRRAFCKRSGVCVLSAVIFVTLGPKLAAAQAKMMTQQQVSYQDQPRGPRQCSNCAVFVPPKSCKIVEGDVSPSGWCVAWKATG
jgi:hypothetical protein